MSDGENAPVDERFLGTWRLVGVSREEVSSGATLDADVKQTGYISYTPDGRMMVIISRADPKQNAPSLTCYAARWWVEDDHVIHSIDMAARTSWVGTQQIRYFEFAGNRLTLRPPVSADFTHGTVTRRALEWEKVGV
jgi:hypothetical protein